jgi:uncharacterized protein
MKLPIIRIDWPRSYPPRPTNCTKTFWDSLSQGIFQTSRCNDCDRLTFPPKPICPHCWSSSLRWEPLSGRGTLYSRTIIHAVPAVFSQEAPIHVGIIDLDEGLRVVTRLLGTEALPLGSAMEIMVTEYTDGPLFAARERKT